MALRPKSFGCVLAMPPTSSIAVLLRERYVLIRRFAEDAEASFLPLRLA